MSLVGVPLRMTSSCNGSPSASAATGSVGRPRASIMARTANSRSPLSNDRSQHTAGYGIEEKCKSELIMRPSRPPHRWNCDCAFRSEIVLNFQHVTPLIFLEHALCAFWDVKYLPTATIELITRINKLCVLNMLNLRFIQSNREDYFHFRTVILLAVDRTKLRLHSSTLRHYLLRRFLRAV